MSSLNKNKKNNNKEQPVSHLNPIFGIQPIIYIPTIFLLIGISIIFFLCIYPGFSYYGSRLYVKSFPKGAAIFIDDKLIGSTPYKGFIPAGKSIIRLEKSHYETHSSSISIKGRRVFSLFFPKKQKYNTILQLNNLHKFLADSYYQASSRYSLQEDKIYKRPPIVLDTVNDLIQTQDRRKHINWNSLITVWALALRDLIQDEGSWQDITKAWDLIENSELAPSLPKSLETIRKALTFSDVLETLSFQQVMPTTIPNTDFKNFLNHFLKISNMTFKLAPASILHMGQAGESLEYYPHNVFIPTFYYLEDYYTKPDYYRLTQDNNALSTGGASIYTGLPYAKIEMVLNILNINLKNQGYKNMEARLPTEAEWQYLAQTQRVHSKHFEWTSDNYIPYRALYYSGLAFFPQPFATSEKVIRGQSDFSGKLPLWQRSGFPADENNHSLAFRIVIASKSLNPISLTTPKS